MSTTSTIPYPPTRVKVRSAADAVAAVRPGMTLQRPVDVVVAEAPTFRVEVADGVDPDWVRAHTGAPFTAGIEEVARA